MSVFSKGSWQLDNATGEISADNVKVCKVYGATVHNVGDNASECMANARLIANAPKVFHYLRKAHSSLVLNVWAQILADEIQALIDCIDGTEVHHD